MLRVLTRHIMSSLSFLRLERESVRMSTRVSGLYCRAPSEREAIESCTYSELCIGVSVARCEGMLSGR